MEKSIIKLKNVSKYYYSKGLIASGFSKINLEFHMGEFVAITGESGSGKSTLLNVISGLDTYEEGEMYINGEETSHFLEKDFEDYRRKYIGNIFQNFNLVNSYTVYQNIELVLLLNGEKKKTIKPKVIELIKKVDLYKFRNTKVSKLSGGQKQRVSIARALAKDTPIIIADEPTGNLDSKSAESIIKLLSEIAKDKLVIIVTHNYDQVSPYVTRKIKMHDGKILEDKIIKKVSDDIKANETEYKDIKFLSKIKLGIRNTFNIIPKFLLILAVFMFIVWALMAEYASFKRLEYEESKDGYNMAFNDTSDNRVIIRKKDKTSISEEDYKNIENISNVKKIVKNDLLIDRESDIYYDDTWINVGIRTLDNLNEIVDVGRLPINDKEVVLEGNEDSWYLSEMKDQILNHEFYYYIDDQDKSIKFTIVGIKYNNNNWSMKLYVSDSLLEIINRKQYINNSSIEVLFKNKYDYYWLVPSNRVKKGKVIISEDLNYLCKNFDCKKEKPSMKIEVKNKYYEDSIKLKVSNTYNKKNINKLTGYSYKKYNSAVFVNENDYYSLFDKGNFQSSIYIDDVKKIDETVQKLNNLGFETLKLKDTLVNNAASAVIQIFRTIVTIILVIVLFFISYFVIKIILSSRNVYYTTIRMLGGSKEVSKELLLIELLNVANISYFTFILVLYLKYIKVINWSFLNTIIEYLGFKEYVIMYLILMFMSCLISMRFSRKIFKNSVMVTLQEEV